MRQTVFTQAIGPTRYSFAYHWHLAVSDQTLKADAEREAALDGVQADVIALRAGAGHAQFGLGWLAANDRRKGTVAAIAFATVQANHTARKALALFDIGPAWWLCILDDDLIHDEGDRVFFDLHDALGVFSTTLFQKHWDRIYFPDGLLQHALARYKAAAANGQQADKLDEILYLRTHTKTSVPLQTTPLHQLLANTNPVTHYQRTLRRFDIQTALSSRPALAAYALLGLVAFFTVGQPAYQRYMHPAPPKPAPAPVAVAPPAPAPIPILNTPIPPRFHPSALLVKCFDLVADLDDKLPPGWSDKGLSCDTQAATMKADRDDGAIERLEQAWPSAHYSYSDDYSHVTVSLPMQLDVTVVDEPLPEADQIRRRLYAIGWATDEKITVSRFSPPPGRLPIDRATWHVATFQIDTPTTPSEWARVLDRLPGVTVTALSVDLGQAGDSLRWRIQGTIYAAQ